MTKEDETIEPLFDTDSDETLTPENLHNQQIQIQLEKIAQRQRQITAVIQIPQPVEKVWQVLTDYEALPEFIPNLAKSKLLDHPNGGIRLEQVGSQSLLNFKFCARVILDLEELFPQSISFRMIEGDFKDFSGSWCLEPCLVNGKPETRLSYTIKVWPKLIMPVSIIESRLSKDLQTNLQAIYQRSINLAGGTT
jgi:ribosome-associated toxin RatA of RatAB toxin-antitoxin module